MLTSKNISLFQNYVDFTLLFQVKSFQLPIVIDADGLWHLTINPDILKGYQKAVITPNAMEFSRYL